jgi:hypothetical protein
VTGPGVPDRRVQGARALARLLDEAVRVPGTGIRVGLDPVLGLVPGLGDVVGGALSGYVVLLAARLGAPKAVLLRMLVNVGIDSLLGAVPVLGDLFDVGWKANTRNLALLEEYVERPRAVRKSSMLVAAGVIGGIALLVAGTIALAVAAVKFLAGLAT